MKQENNKPEQVNGYLSLAPYKLYTLLKLLKFFQEFCLIYRFFFVFLHTIFRKG